MRTSSFEMENINKHPPKNWNKPKNLNECMEIKCQAAREMILSISYCIPEPEEQVPPSVHVPLLPLTPLLAMAPRST